MGGTWCTLPRAAPDRSGRVGMWTNRLRGGSHPRTECAREVKRLDDDDGAYARLLNAPKLSEGGLAILQASNLSNDLIARLQPKFVLRYPRHA